MEWLILIPVCLLGGWWLFSMLLGGTDEAINAVKESPGRGCAGIVFFAIVVLIGLCVLGFLTRG
jgi:hypothetical protein